jgi:hypothetical protein
MYNNDNETKHTQIYTTKFTNLFFIHNSSELSIDKTMKINFDLRFDIYTIVDTLSTSRVDLI